MLSRLLRVGMLLALLLIGLAPAGARGATAAQAACIVTYSSPTSTHTGETAAALRVLPSGGVWAVGGYHQPTAFYLSPFGDEWLQAPLPPANTSYSGLRAVDGVARNNAWAVGYDSVRTDDGLLRSVPLLLRFDGNIWTKAPPPAIDASAELNGVLTLAHDDAWAVGQQGEPGVSLAPLLLHWDDHSWTVQPGPNPADLGDDPFSGSLRAIAGSKDNLWVASDRAILHWDGAAWSLSYRAYSADLFLFAALAVVGPNDVWAVGAATEEPGERPLALHWDGQGWRRYPVPQTEARSRLTAIAAAPGNLIAVGVNETISRNPALTPLLVRWNGSAWEQLVAPQSAALNGSALFAVAANPDGSAWLAGSNGPDPLLAHYSPACVAQPTATPLPSATPTSPGRIFPETGMTVFGRFLDYWNANGGLAQQGYPISQIFTEQSDLNGMRYAVQYFERAVFELHPENQPPYDVLLSQLGSFRYKQKYPNGAPNQQPNHDRAHYFAETGHWVGGDFWEYWQAHGGLAQQGYPISDEFSEVSDLNGQPYTVQYFERAVFEYHPENNAPYKVLLSQLGAFRAHEKYPQGFSK